MIFHLARRGTSDAVCEYGSQVARRLLVIARECAEKRGTTLPDEGLFCDHNSYFMARREIGKSNEHIHLYLHDPAHEEFEETLVAGMDLVKGCDPAVMIISKFYDLAGFDAVDADFIEKEGESLEKSVSEALNRDLKFGNADDYVSNLKQLYKELEIDDLDDFFAKYKDADSLMLLPKFCRDQFVSQALYDYTHEPKC